MKLGRYIKEMCVCQADFAKKIGITQATIGNMLKGKGDMHLSFAVRIEEITEGKVTCRDLVNVDVLKQLELKAKFMQMEK